MARLRRRTAGPTGPPGAARTRGRSSRPTVTRAGRTPIPLATRPPPAATRPTTATVIPGRPGGATAMTARPVAVTPNRPAVTRPTPARAAGARTIPRPAAGTGIRPARLTVLTRVPPGRTRAARGPARATRGGTRAGGAAALRPARPRRARARLRPRPARTIPPRPRLRAGAATAAAQPRLPRPRLAWAIPTAATWTRPRRAPPGPGAARGGASAHGPGVSAGPAACERQQLFRGVRDRPDGGLLGPVRPGSRRISGDRPAAARRRPGGAGFPVVLGTASGIPGGGIAAAGGSLPVPARSRRVSRSTRLRHPAGAGWLRQPAACGEPG